MNNLGRTAVLAPIMAVLQAACATGQDSLAMDMVVGARSICNVPFEAGQVVAVSGEFDGDRYHNLYLTHPDCPRTLWTADWTDQFEARFGKLLGLSNAILPGSNYGRYRIEVEGRLFISSEGQPAIELQKLGKSERISR